MEKIYQAIHLVLCMTIAMLFITSCSDDLPEPEKKLEGNTVIIYMGAENSLSYHDSYDEAFSKKDIDEMILAAPQIPEDCQVVVFKDDELNPVIFRINKKGKTTWKQYEQELNSGDPATMKNVLLDITKNFPSNKYSLILWSHGSGWINANNSRAIIVDNQKNTTSNNGSWINISDLSNVLSTLPHMEYIMFDACYMQSVEVIAELYTHANYIIGSPTEIPGNGAPYDIIMKSLCKADISGIINGYASEYSTGNGVLLSAVSCAKFPDFCTETSKYIAPSFNKSNMPGVAGIQIYAPTNIDMPVPYDMRSAMHRVLSEEDYQTWEVLWRNTILYPRYANSWETVHEGFFHCTIQDPEHYGGISMNIPNTRYDSKGWNAEFKQTAWYRLAYWEQTGW